MLDKINEDLKQAMLANDIAKVSVLRMVKSELQNQAIANKGTLNDDDALAVLKREVKKRREAAQAYQDAGDELRANTENAEAEIIEEYLPEQLSEEEIEKIVNETINETGSDNIGQVIGAVMGKVQGKADGALVSKIVKEKMSQ